MTTPNQASALAPAPTKTSTSSDFDALSERNTLVRNRAADFLGVEPSALLKVLRAHFNDGQGEFSALELLTAITLIGRYGLDPMRREIHVVRSRGRVFTCIGIDGWIRIVTGNPHYDGHETEFEKDDRGNVVSATVKIHHRERSHPTSYTAIASEWTIPTNPNWKQRPGHMLGLRAFTHAARYFCAIGQVYESSEIDDLISRENARDSLERSGTARLRLETNATKSERAVRFSPPAKSVPAPSAPASKGRMAASAAEEDAAPPPEEIETPWDDLDAPRFEPDPEPEPDPEETETPTRATKEELVEIARELGVKGAEKMFRVDLEAAIRERS